MDDPIVALPQPTWGARIYIGYDRIRSVGSGSEDLPAWSGPRWHSDLFQRGLFIWDHASRQIGFIWASEALALMEKMRAEEVWKTEGASITHRVMMIMIADGWRSEALPGAVSGAGDVSSVMFAKAIDHTFHDIHHES